MEGSHIVCLGRQPSQKSLGKAVKRGTDGSRTKFHAFSILHLFLCICCVLYFLTGKQREMASKEIHIDIVSTMSPSSTAFSWDLLLLPWSPLLALLPLEVVEPFLLPPLLYKTITHFTRKKGNYFEKPECWNPELVRRGAVDDDGRRGGREHPPSSSSGLSPGRVGPAESRPIKKRSHQNDTSNRPSIKLACSLPLPLRSDPARCPST